MRKIFRELISLDEAKKRLFSAVKVIQKVEEIPLTEAYGRILAEDYYSEVDIPPFDRATMDGYAVKAEDTFGAEEDNPVELKVIGKVEAGEVPNMEVRKGTAVEISTGAVIPKGANAVVMVEYTSRKNDSILIYKPVPPGANIMSAGSDIRAGELLVRKGTKLTAREIGVLASAGFDKVKVITKPKIAVVSTGNELKSPGEKLEFGKIYDVNTYTICAGIIENGGEPIPLGIARDDESEIRSMILRGLELADMVILSGGTSAGVGDKIYRILGELGEILAHGIAVKPGKPTVLAIVDDKPVIGLPGYPTSALMIFELIVAPLIRLMAGLQKEEYKSIKARIPIRYISAMGRREFLPVNIVKSEGGFVAYPFVDYSGAISTLAEADGFVEIPENKFILEENEEVEVRLFGDIKVADLMIIGSHCIGVDVLVDILQKRGILAKVINVGSTGGIMAIKRGEADIAGVHLLDPYTGMYNIPYLLKYGLKGQAVLVRGYIREQGLIVAKGNPKKIEGIEDLLRSDVTFINRNAGSGTRILLDMYLKKIAEDRGLSFDDIKRSIKGYDVEAKSHTAVAIAVLMGKADVGLGIRAVAERYGLDFIPIKPEEYDFVIRKDRLNKDAVKEFIKVLRSNEFKDALERKIVGIKVTDDTGKIIEF
ncbi:MAG TPA: molybdopterin biosynthesis protein [Archaeoglobus profundus]|nr:molybdopterin biosynthesis protein [Archaeoglobus profundus]